jgi:hypothetical protein
MLKFLYLDANSSTVQYPAVSLPHGLSSSSFLLENVQRMLHCRASRHVDGMLRYIREGLIPQADDDIGIHTQIKV